VGGLSAANDQITDGLAMLQRVTAALATAALAPFRRVRDLEAALWSMCVAHLYPARYREVAQRLLANVLCG
jgi:hypothetical protein